MTTAIAGIEDIYWRAGGQLAALLRALNAMPCHAVQRLIKRMIEHTKSHQILSAWPHGYCSSVFINSYITIRQQHARNNSAEALAEALYLFQTPSALKPAEKLTQHCLLFSLTEAHNMAVGWPYPLQPGAENQASALHICLALCLTLGQKPVKYNAV